MDVLAGVPRWAMLLFWLLVAVVVVILFALVVHALGGFDQRCPVPVVGPQGGPIPDWRRGDGAIDLPARCWVLVEHHRG